MKVITTTRNYWSFLSFFFLYLLTTSQLMGSPIIGTLDFSRAGSANILDGDITDELRASLLANFPGVQIVASPSLSNSFLSTIELLIVTNAAGSQVGTSLTVAEQLAVTTFVENGGSAIVFGDPFFGLSAQTVVEPFEVTFANDLISGDDFFNMINLDNNPIANGPIGFVPAALAYEYGWFDNLGPYASTLAINEFNGMPSILRIPENAMAPGSGRVLIFGDAGIVGDFEIGGVFVLNETM